MHCWKLITFVSSSGVVVCHVCPTYRDSYMALVGHLWLNWPLCRRSAWAVCLAGPIAKPCWAGANRPGYFCSQDCLQFGKWPVAQCGNRWRVHSVSEAETEPNDSEWKQHSDIVNYSNKDVKLQVSNSSHDNVQDKDAVLWIISKCNMASLIKPDLVT